MARFELRLLGEPQLRLGDQDLILPTRKLWALLAYLSVNGKGLLRKKLSGLLWENHSDVRARANLRQELHRLRGSEVERLFVSLEDTLELADHDSDLIEVRKHHRAQNWAALLEHYRGEFAEGLEVRGAPVFEDWLTLEREHWKSIWQEAARRQVQLLEQEGKLIAARALYVQILQHDPFQEDLQRALIRLTAQTESTPAALVIFNSYKALLKQEFSLSPLPQTLELVEQLASGQMQSADAAQATLLPGGLNHPKLVGRQREWGIMEAAWQKGQAIYLSGPAGVGKSRLMLEFSASKGPYLHLQGRQSDTDVPYAYLTRSLRQALTLLDGIELPTWTRRELSRLNPELGDEAPPMRSEADKLRLMEALTDVLRRLSQVGIVAIVADDLQFVGDTASNEFARYSMERLLPIEKLHSVPEGIPEGTLRYITTFRSDEIRPAILQGIEEQIRQGIALRIELGALDSLAVHEFVHDLSGQAAPLFSQRLYQSTAGNPLFMIETLRSLFSSGEIVLEGDRWYTPYDQETENYRELPIPQSVRQAVVQRVNRLGGGVQRLLEAASLSGEVFTLDELAGATALSEWEALEALETAQKFGLVRPVLPGYSFAHDLIRKAMAESLSSGRAQLLHLKLVAALERLEGAPGRIAHHLEQAARPKQAIPWRIRAAEQATSVFALREALDHYSKALENGAGSLTAFSVHKARCQLWADLSEFEPWAKELDWMERLATHDPDLEAQTSLLRIQWAERSSRYQQAIDTAAALLTQDDLAPSYRHRALYARGKALLQLGRTDEALEQLGASLHGLPKELVELEGSIQISLLVCNERLGNLPKALQHGRLALKAARGDLQVKIQAIDSIGRIQSRQGQYRQALASMTDALKLARETQHVYMQRQVLLNLYGVHYHLGDFESGIACLEEGLSLTQAQQDPLTEGTFLNNLGFAFRQRGELGEAIQNISASIAIADQIAMPFQQAWRRITLADLLLEVGSEPLARPLLLEARDLIASANLHPLKLWWEAVWVRANLHSRNADVDSLLALLTNDKASAPDRDRAHWIVGLVRLTNSDFADALEAVGGLGQSSSMGSRALGVQLLATKALGTSLDELIKRAEKMLKGNLPALESLELRHALVQVLEHKPKVRQHSQLAHQQAHSLSQSLSQHPELQENWQRLYQDLLG